MALRAIAVYPLCVLVKGWCQNDCQLLALFDMESSGYTIDLTQLELLLEYTWFSDGKNPSPPKLLVDSFFYVVVVFKSPLRLTCLP